MAGALGTVREEVGEPPGIKTSTYELCTAGPCVDASRRSQFNWIELSHAMQPFHAA